MTDEKKVEVFTKGFLRTLKSEEKKMEDGWDKALIRTIRLLSKAIKEGVLQLEIEKTREMEKTQSVQEY